MTTASGPGWGSNTSRYQWYSDRIAGDAGVIGAPAVRPGADGEIAERRHAVGAPPGIYIHFAAEFFKIKTQTDILFVPYKGATPMITDLLGGHIDMVFNNKSTLLTHFKEAKLKPLAVTSEVRWPELPDTPTMKEVGVTGFPREVIFGLLAPAGTSPAIVDKLNQAVNEGLKSAEVRASLAKIGMEARTGTAQDFAAALADQVREWKTVVDATGIKVD